MGLISWKHLFRCGSRATRAVAPLNTTTGCLLPPQKGSSKQCSPLHAHTASASPENRRPPHFHLFEDIDATGESLQNTVSGLAAPKPLTVNCRELISKSARQTRHCAWNEHSHDRKKITIDKPIRSALPPISRALLLSLVLTAWPHGASCQSPDQSSPNNRNTEPTQETPRIELRGRVLDSGNGLGFYRALITLENSDTTLTAAADEDGRFTLAGLAPGRYGLLAKPPGHSQVAIHRLLVLRQGEVLHSETLTLDRPASLTGRVLDDAKHPVAGAVVSARGLLFVRGGLTHTPDVRTLTDERGEYRLEGLQPGREYWLGVHGRETLRVLAGHPAHPPAGTTAAGWSYYPNLPSPQAMLPVVLRAGEDRGNTDLELRPAQSQCRYGQLVGFTQSAVEVEVETADEQPGWSVKLGRGSTDNSGRFTLCGLSHGRFRAKCLIQAERVLWGESVFDVGGAPLEQAPGIPLPVQPFDAVTGVLRWADREHAGKPMPGIRLVAQPDGRMPAPGESLEAESLGEGAFRFTRLRRSPYRVQLYGLPHGVYLKSLRYGAADLLEEPLQPGSQMQSTAIEGVLAEDGGAVQVQTVDDKGQPAPDALVIVFPKDAESLEALARRIHPLRTPADGSLRISALAPGRYRVLALTGVIDITPAVLTRIFALREKAEPLTIGASNEPSIRVLTRNLKASNTP